MLVSNLREFIRLLGPPLKAAGLNQVSEKSVTGSLDSLASALEPFDKMSTDQLAELLRASDEYRRTGVIPEWVGAGKSAAPAKAPRAPKAPKLTPADALAKLRDLQERALSLEPTEIDRQVQTLAPLTLKELQEVQKGFLGVNLGKKKDEVLNSLLKKIVDARASRDRVAGILAY